MDFSRTIVIDSLSLPVSNVNRTPVRYPPADFIIGACLDSASYAQRCQFYRHGGPVVGRCGGAGRAGRPARRHPKRRQFTERGAQCLLLGRPPGDRLWQGILGLVLVFIVHLITQTKKRRTASTSSSSAIAAAGLLLGPQSLDNIYRCINRCIQCILSRPAESVSEKMFILEDFHKLTTNRYLSVRLFLHFIF